MKRVLCSTKFLQLKSAPKPDGQGEWAYAHRPNVNEIVIVVPVISYPEGKKVLFLKTVRPPLVNEGYAKFNIELPAGLVGDECAHETLIECAQKELLEEAGLVAQKLEVKTQKLSSSAGCTSEVACVVVAYVDGSTERFNPQDDGGVIVEREEVFVEEIFVWLKIQEKEGNTIGAQTLAGLFYIK